MVPVLASDGKIVPICIGRTHFHLRGGQEGATILQVCRFSFCRGELPPTLSSVFCPSGLAGAAAPWWRVQPRTSLISQI